MGTSQSPESWLRACCFSVARNNSAGHVWLCAVPDNVQYTVQCDDNGRHRRRQVFIDLSTASQRADLAQSVARDGRPRSLRCRNWHLRGSDVQRSALPETEFLQPVDIDRDIFVDRCRTSAVPHVGVSRQRGRRDYTCSASHG